MPYQNSDETRQKLPGKGKTIFVTGIAGFIAARVAEILVEQGYKVIGIDNLNDYYDQRLKYYRLAKLFNGEDLFRKFFETNSRKKVEGKYQFGDWLNIFPAGTDSKYSGGNHIISIADKSLHFHLGDIENQSLVNEICEEYKPDAIVNLAARAGVRASIQNPHIYVSTNTIGCLNLLEASKIYKIKKFILASTSSLYAGQPLPFSEELPVNNPISPYAASKKGAETMSYTYHYLYGISVTILRYFTVYGPAGRPDMSIYRFINWINNDKKIEIYGDGIQSRDFTFIDDIAQGTVSSLKLNDFNIINLGGGKEQTNLNTALDMIQQKTGKTALIKYKKKENSDIKHTLASNNKAKSLLQWKTKTNFNRGLDLTLKWHKSNHMWSSKINT